MISSGFGAGLEDRVGALLHHGDGEKFLKNMSKPVVVKSWEIIILGIFVTLGPSGPNAQNESQKCDA